MTTSISLYNHTRRHIANGGVDLDADAIKIILVTSGYVFNPSHVSYADCIANEVTGGAGYNTGGELLTSAAVLQETSNAAFRADNVVWSSLTKTFRGAIIYDDTYVLPNVGGGQPANAYKALLAYILLDTAPADIVVTNIDYSIQWNSAGIFTFNS